MLETLKSLSFELPVGTERGSARLCQPDVAADVHSRVRLQTEFLAFERLKDCPPSWHALSSALTQQVLRHRPQTSMKRQTPDLDLIF